jgi:hypothetical protein
MRIIEAKAAGAEIAEPAAAPVAKVTDLMAALEASVAAARASRRTGEPQEIAAARASKATRKARSVGVPVMAEPEVGVAQVRRRKSA